MLGSYTRVFTRYAHIDDIPTVGTSCMGAYTLPHSSSRELPQTQVESCLPNLKKNGRENVVFLSSVLICLRRLLCQGDDWLLHRIVEMEDMEGFTVYSILHASIYPHLHFLDVATRISTRVPLKQAKKVPNYRTFESPAFPNLSLLYKTSLLAEVRKLLLQLNGNFSSGRLMRFDILLSLFYAFKKTLICIDSLCTK